MHRIEMLLARLFLALLAVVLTVALAEFAGRHLWRATSDPLRGISLPKAEPYVMFGFQGRVSDPNALGYRGPVPTVPKSPHEFRIVMLGGSAVFLGDPPLPQLLEDALHRAGLDDARVYNFGVPASVSGMELARLTFEVASVEPDLVVMYNGGNDIALPFVFDPRPGYPTNFYVYESNPLLDPERYSLEELLAQRSVLVRRMFPGYFNKRFLRLDDLRRAAGWGTPAWQDRIARVYVTNLSTAARVSRGLGAQFLGFLQPLIYFKRSLDPAENAFVPAVEKRAPGMQRHCVAVRERMRAALNEAPADVKPMLFDLTAIYDDTADRVFLDFVHTTQAARLPVVNAIAREILERRR